MLLYVDAQYASPYAMSAFVALTELDMPFSLETVDLGAGANHQPAYVASSLTRRVPTLLHGSFTLSESSAIGEYLHDIVPGSHLYPADPQSRARCRQVQAWLRSDLDALRRERTTEVVFYGQKVPQALSPAALSSAEKLIRAAATMLAHGQEHLFGRWCMADLDLALMLNRLVMNDEPVPEELVLYAQRQWSRPAVQAWLELPRPALQRPH